MAEVLTPRPRCTCCGEQMDPDTCHCGIAKADHHDMEEGHAFCPMGCVCGYAAMSELKCPFCEMDGFDRVGLKAHLTRGHCEQFEAITNEGLLFRTQKETDDGKKTRAT